MDFLPDILSRVSITGSGVADLLFFLAALFAAVVSLILFFHWRKYGMKGRSLALTEVIYLAGCALLISAAFLSIP